ncbi:flagellar hook-associated protein 3 [uncultured Brachyspira sp.]|uniref:flagellar hook-associated protein 3 n=1 Tax=uncultured Brachyspira sp. TaxID=221953 RepID=UPI0025F1AA05|nr:flagellar hook-associated protein 3 [uncultured Brachyspira sp.]
MRVTEQSQLNGTVRSIRMNKSEMTDSQTRLSTGQRVQYPHQNVTATINSIYYRTRMSSVDAYQNNIIDGRERLNVAHDSMSAITEALNRARDLAVQGANSTYGADDRAKMAMEVEEMIERIYDISKTQSKGEFIFSGTSIKTAPFMAFYGHDERAGRSIVKSVIYEGDGNPQNREIENGQIINVATPGNYAFWGTDMEIISTSDSSAYIAAEDQDIMIDDMVINIKQGDNIEAVVQRINDANGNVSASIGDLRGGQKVIQLKSGTPHKILLQDLAGGTVLQDIGLVRIGAANNPENNYEPSALVTGKSIFESLIYLRDAMLNDDVGSIGGEALGYIDSSLDNVLTVQANASSKTTRLDMGYNSFEDQKLAIQEALAKNENIDYAEEIINFNMWQYAHNASLQTAGKLLGRTLMDYLR